MTAALGGHIDFMLGNPGEVLPQIQAGTLRPIAVSTPARLPSLSEVPSFTELGYNIEHVQLRGVVMPPGVPPDVVTFWEGALRSLAESEQWKRDYLDRFRDEPRFVGSKEFGRLLESPDARCHRISADQAPGVSNAVVNATGDSWASGRPSATRRRAAAGARGSATPSGTTTSIPGDY